MSAVGDKLEQLRAEGRPALVGYLPAGFPSVEGSTRAIEAMIDGGVGQRTGEFEHLRPGFVPDAAGEVTNHGRERVRASGGAEQVTRRVDAGHPIAQRLIDRIFEGATAGHHRDDLRTKHLHARHVEFLPLRVNLAHVNHAVQIEVGAGRRRSDTVLAGAGFGDRARLSYSLGEQGLTEHIADLVCARVVEVLALEQDAGPGDFGETRGVIQQAGDAGVFAQHPVEFIRVDGVGLCFCPGFRKFVERCDERLGHESAAKTAKVARGVWLGIGHEDSNSMGRVPDLGATDSPSVLERGVRPGGNEVGDSRPRVVVLDESLAHQHHVGALLRVLDDVVRAAHP